MIMPNKYQAEFWFGQVWLVIGAGVSLVIKTYAFCPDLPVEIFGRMRCLNVHQPVRFEASGAKRVWDSDTPSLPGKWKNLRLEFLRGEGVGRDVAIR